MNNLVLIGMPGVGKTTLGRMLSEKLNREFIDTDDLIVEMAGCQIPEIFANQGEPHFRDLESEAIAKALTHDDAVIALGGGAVLRAENYTMAEDAGAQVVFLMKDIEELEKLDASNRPVSQKHSAAELYEARLPYYLAWADEILDITGDTPEESLTKLIAMIG